MKEASPSAISSLTAAKLPNAQVGDPQAVLRYVSEEAPLNATSQRPFDTTHLAGGHAELGALAHAISQAASLPSTESMAGTSADQRRAHSRVGLENIRAASTAINDWQFAEEVGRVSKATILSLRS